MVLGLWVAGVITPRHMVILASAAEARASLKRAVTDEDKASAELALEACRVQWTLCPDLTFQEHRDLFYIIQEMLRDQA